MNKIKLTILLFIVLGIRHSYAQDTTELSNIVAIKNNIEYNIGTVLISDVLDYNTFTSDQYSADSTRFYLNGVLYTGVGLIDNMEQYTIINFKKGRLDGLWYERLYRNADMTIKGNYKKGLRNGQWEDGWYDSTQYILNGIVSFKNGLLNGPIIFYAFYNVVKDKDVYTEKRFKNGVKVSPEKFFSLDGKIKNGIEINTNIQSYKYSKPITEKNTFEKGIIKRQEISIDDTVIQINEFSISYTSYYTYRTNFHNNGTIESKGQLFDFINELGEWFFYDDKGVLLKKQLWERPLEGDFSEITKTVYFNTDGSIKRTTNY